MIWKKLIKRKRTKGSINGRGPSCKSKDSKVKKLKRLAKLPKKKKVKRRVVKRKR